jgi:hypothetical protein
MEYDLIWYRAPAPQCSHPFGAAAKVADRVVDTQSSMIKEAKKRQIRDPDLRDKDWTQEQIEATDLANATAQEWRQKNPPRKGPPKRKGRI